MFRLVIMHQDHVPAPEGLLGSESDLRLGESMKSSVPSREAEIEDEQQGRGCMMTIYLRELQQDAIGTGDHRLPSPSPVHILLALRRSSRCRRQLSIPCCIQHPGRRRPVELALNAVPTGNVQQQKMAVTKNSWIVKVVSVEVLMRRGQRPVRGCDQ